jgi:hypothetical protein
MTKANVTYLSKSEGGRGQALRAEERGAGGYGERQSFDRGFKYLLCTVQRLAGEVSFAIHKPKRGSCRSHVHETFPLIVCLDDIEFDDVSPHLSNGLFERANLRCFSSEPLLPTCCHAEGEKVRVSLT